MVKVLVKKLDNAVKLPEYKTDGASGMDLMAFIKETIVIKPTVYTKILYFDQMISGGTGCS